METRPQHRHGQIPIQPRVAKARPAIASHDLAAHLGRGLAARASTSVVLVEAATAAQVSLPLPKLEGSLNHRPLGTCS